MLETDLYGTEAHLGPIKFFFGIHYNEFLNS